MINISSSHEHIGAFLNTRHVGVLATASNSGKAHAATVYLTYDRYLNMYFVTKKETQKARNIQQNPYAAIAVSDETLQITVQAEGPVTQITDADQVNGIVTEIWAIAMRESQSRVPPTSKLTAGGYVVYMLSAPSLRMATFNKPDAADYDNIFEVANTEPSLT